MSIDTRTAFQRALDAARTVDLAGQTPGRSHRTSLYSGSAKVVTQLNNLDLKAIPVSIPSVIPRVARSNHPEPVQDRNDEACNLDECDINGGELFQMDELPPPPPPPVPVSKVSDIGVIQQRLVETFERLKEFKPEVDHELKRVHGGLVDLRREIVSASRSNFILERELDVLDEKIKLLVRNRISLREVLSSADDVLVRKKGGLLEPKLRSLYQSVLYTLQSEPKYFARLARVVSGREVQSFVQTVVFDFYGDQYDTREERLLLSLFGYVLRAEFEAAPDMGSLLRANTAITNMLSAYSRRGLGLSILKDILEEPLLRITSELDLDLELNPVTIYTEIVREKETGSGERFTGRKDLTCEEAMQLPEVIAIVEPRRARLMSLAGDILNRICSNVDSVPYGMRWISRKLRDLAVEFFPQADNKRIGSLIGGYIYLRFFNPVIVTPDAIDFVRTKPSKKMRRNLILIAKLLQNLSNGLQFGEKESFMIPCNIFLSESRLALDDYFSRLVDVDDMRADLTMDKWLERTAKRSMQVQMSFNQLFMIHGLLANNIDLVCEKEEHVSSEASQFRRQILQLGPAPAQLKTVDNHTVGLELRPPAVADLNSNPLTRHSVASISGFQQVNLLQPNSTHPLHLDASKLLLEIAHVTPASVVGTAVMNTIGETADCKASAASLREVLSFVQNWAHKTGHDEIEELVRTLIALLTTLHRMQLLPNRADTEDPFDGFFFDLVDSVEARTSHLNILSKRRQLIKKATDTVRQHHDYLQSRLELYQVYLDNVRAGRALPAASGFGKPAAALRAALRQFPSANASSHGASSTHSGAAKFKLTHVELEAMGVIIAVDPDVRKAILKKTSFTFSETSNPNQFQVTAHYSKARAPMSPIMLDLEELLDRQSNNLNTLRVPNMVLNVNLLIHLINTRFLALHK